MKGIFLGKHYEISLDKACTNPAGGLSPFTGADHLAKLRRIQTLSVHDIRVYWSVRVHVFIGTFTIFKILKKEEICSPAPKVHGLLSPI